MFTILLALAISVVITYLIVRRAVRIGITRNTAATERTAAILEAVLQPEQRARVQAVEAQWERDRATADLAYRRKRAAALWAIIIGTLLLIAQGAKAQGIYMGRDGRVHAQVIVDADGSAFPVVPTPCYGGPCPAVLAPPPSSRTSSPT
jgi:hypothetical protein